MAKKGFSYTVPEEALEKWIAMPPELKLDWLEEINDFIFKFAPEKSKEAISKFRKGEI
ncbi:MAG: hypothetical protein V3R86_06980 [Candidatus Hydrothermarchaeaceae archaeon]